MSEPDKQPEIHSIISEAIRAKRGKSPSSTQVDLAALEASLVAEIEAFELRTAAPQSPASPTPSPIPAGEKKEAKLFPEIVADGAVRIPQPQGKPAPQPASASPAPQAPKASLLEQLRQQVQARQQDSSARQREVAALEKRMDAALRSIFSYCHELVQQLNVLHPPVDRPYAMLGSFEFSGLEWKEGFADYRTRPDSTEAVYESVSLNCLLSKPEQVRIEKDVLAADKFRKTLFDQGLVFTCEEVRNTRHMVEKTVFSISAEVRVNLRWLADPERGVLALETRNLERFGSLSYTISPDSVGPAMLDELARLLLGQGSRFRDYCANVGPSAYNR